MSFRWRADDDPTLNACLKALWCSGGPHQYNLETLYFCDFSGGPDPLSPPPLEPRMSYDIVLTLCVCWEVQVAGSQTFGFMDFEN